MPKKLHWTASAIALAVSSAFAQSAPQASSPTSNQYQLAYLDPVVVTASRFEEPRSSASAVIDVISRAEIESSGANNISEFLDQIPGATLSRLYGRLGVDASLDIGYLGESGTQNVLILLDGQRLNPFDQSSVNFLQVPISVIERIEVRRASGGVLFGDRAQGGVVNIITRTDSRREVAASLGSFGYKKVDTFIGFSSGVVFGSVSGLKADSDGYRDFNSSAQRSGRFAIGGLTPVGTISFAWSGFNEKLQLPGSLTQEQFAANPKQAASGFSSVIESERTGDMQSVRYEYPQGARGSFLLDVSRLKTRQISGTIYRDYPEWGKTTRIIENERSTIQPEIKRRFDLLTIVVGAEVFSMESNTDGGKQVTQKSSGIYGQASQGFSGGHTLDVGVRRQEVKNRFQEAKGAAETESSNNVHAFTFGGRVRVSEISFVRLGVLNGFRFANADELYYYNNALGDPNRYSPLSVNPNVKPMRSNEVYVEAAVRERGSEYGVHWRSIKTKDEIGSSDDCGVVSGVLVGCNTNLFNTSRQIMTLFLKADLTKAMTFTSSLDFVDAVIDSGDNKGNRIPVTPRRAMKAGVTYSLDDRRKLLARVNYRDDMVPALAYGGSSNRIPQRAVYDFGFQSSERLGFSWSAWLRNFSNKSYYDYAAESFGVYGVYPADRRAFEVNARYVFD